jgi:hypothetical protein
MLIQNLTINFLSINFKKITIKKFINDQHFIKPALIK